MFLQSSQQLKKDVLGAGPGPDLVHQVQRNAVLVVKSLRIYHAVFQVAELGAYAQAVSDVVFLYMECGNMIAGIAGMACSNLGREA